MLIASEYEVVYWKTAEHREQGISDFAGSRMSLNEAVHLCECLVYKQGMICAEVRAINAEKEDLLEETVFYCGPCFNGINGCNGLDNRCAS